jgi:hypothetical protein
MYQDAQGLEVNLCPGWQTQVRLADHNMAGSTQVSMAFIKVLDVWFRNIPHSSSSLEFGTHGQKLKNIEGAMKFRFQ